MRWDGLWFLMNSQVRITRAELLSWKSQPADTDQVLMLAILPILHPPPPAAERGSGPDRLPVPRPLAEPLCCVLILPHYLPAPCSKVETTGRSKGISGPLRQLVLNLARMLLAAFTSPLFPKRG